jgi:competence protein ComEC
MNSKYAILCAFSAITGIWFSKKLSITGVVIIAILVITLYFQLKGRSVLFLMLLTFFFFYSHLYNQWNTSILSPSENIFQGKVDTIPVIDGKMISFHFKTPQETVLVRYKMKSASQKEELKHVKINMRCMLNGTLMEPEAKNNFYGMDYQQYLRNHKIFWILEPDSVQLKTCKQSDNNGFISTIKLWRSQSIGKLEANFSPNTAGLMNALLFGYREGIEPETLQAYQRLGLTHLLAVSGFNVGIVSYLLYLLLVRVGFVKEVAYGLIVCILPVYVILTGSESSIVRAGIMGMLFFLFIIFGKKLNPAIVLSAVCIAMLLINPALAFDLGFQLSFLMTFVLITSMSLFHSKSFLRLLCTTSCMCSFFSFPVIVYNFYEFSLWSIPLNILYIPLVSTVLFPVSFIVYILLMLVPSGIVIISEPAEFLFEKAASILNVFTDFYGSVLLGKPSLFLILLYFASLIYMFYKWEKRGRFQFINILPFMIIIVIHVILPYLTPSATVSFINVGQGDCILIELPYRKGVYLIDTGGTFSFEKEEWEMPNEEFDVTKKIVIPYLKARGINKLDGLILSHGDMDHAGGAILLLENFQIKKLFMGNTIKNELEKEIQSKAKSKGVEVQYLINGLHWSNKGAYFLVMHPSVKHISSNNQSIVLWAEIHHTSFLFTGDIEKEAEQDVLAKYQSLQADILKVAHHGSKTSSTDRFIEKVSPKISIISVGKNNIYGHPNREVLERLEQKNIKIYRTDLNGDVKFTISKNDLSAITVK